MALAWDEFIEKLDWEGGVVGFLEWGGTDAFPVELQPAAKRVEEALQEIEDFINKTQDIYE